MSVKAMTIVLKSEGRLVSLLDMERGDDPIMVGRTPSCALCTPGDDKSISGKHARFFWKSGNLYLEDAGSRNGVFRNGERLDRPVKVKPGDVFTIGSCTLEVEKTKAQSSAQGGRCHQLRFTRGGRKGRLIDVKPGSDGVFTIGSIPGSGLFLNDRGVSRHHAKLFVEGGDCWIVDEGSRNGTLVNGESVGAKRQLLRPGDRISVLQYELEFDPAPAGPNFGKALMTLSLLSAIGVVAWLYYSRIGPTPPAEHYRKCAMDAAEKENFTIALEYVRKAMKAKDADADDQKRANNRLHESIGEWKTIAEEWKRAQDSLSRANLVAARAALDALQNPIYNWTWNTNTAHAAKKDAFYCHDVMRRYTDALDFIEGLENRIRERRDPEMSPVRLIKERIAAVDQELATTNKVCARLKFLAPLFMQIGKERDNLAVVLKGVERIDGAIDGISVANPDFRDAARMIGDAAKDKAMPPCVARYAESMLPFCTTFVRTQEFLEKERKMVADMEFLEIIKNKGNIPIPTLDACGRNATLSNSRAAFLKRHEAYLNEVRTLSPMVDNLDKLGVRDGEKGDVLKYVCTPEIWDKALKFDCFQMRVPRSGRKAPQGEYDRLLGIESTYENLRELPKPAALNTTASMNFVPECRKAKNAFEYVVTFRNYMDRRESREFMGGKLGKLYALGAQILADRARLIEMLKERERNAATGRERLIAGYYAQFFADKPLDADMKALEGSFRQLQREINSLDGLIEQEPNPEYRLKLRKRLLETGIPGMEVVRKRWVEAISE